MIFFLRIFKPLVFRFESLREAENMASLVDGFCCFKCKSSKTSSSSLWSKVIKKSELDKLSLDMNRKSLDQYHLNVKPTIESPSIYLKLALVKKKNSF